MTGKLSKNFHGVGIGPLSNIFAVKTSAIYRKGGVKNCVKFADYKKTTDGMG